MTAFLGVYLVGCGLLVVAGALKVAHPSDTALALQQWRPSLPVRRVRIAVRGLAGVEALLGLVGLAYPDAVAGALVAASYVGFVGVVCYARARGGPLATCGCFGTPDTPPTLTHASIDAALGFAAAAYAAAGDRAWLPAVLRHQYFRGVPLLIAAGLCGWLAFLAMVRLARLQAASLQLASR
jgi:hypothetical protein